VVRGLPSPRFISLIGGRDRLTADLRDSDRFMSHSFVKTASFVAFFIASGSITALPRDLLIRRLPSSALIISSSLAHGGKIGYRLPTANLTKTFSFIGKLSCGTNR
jgi:hypothetical protein